MTTQINTVNKNEKTLTPNLKEKSSSSDFNSREPALKLNMEEFLKMKELEKAGNIIGIQDLRKRVLKRMESESASSGLETGKEATTSKQVKSTTAASTSISGGNVPVKNGKNIVINHKRPETTSKKDNEDKKVVIKKEKSITTNLKSTGESINREKHGTNKEKPKPSVSAPKISRGNLTSIKGKQSVTIHQEKLTSLTSISKGTSINSSNNNNKGKGKQTVTSKDLSINNDKRSAVSKGLEKCVERWKLLREKGGIYRPLESFLPTDILNDKSQMVTVEKISKEFELKRLRRLLEKDKEKPNCDKKFVQKRIEHLNNVGKDLTRLEIAAFRNEKGPTKDQQIRAYIAYLNEKNKNKKVTKLDIIEDSNYLKKGYEQFQEEQTKQNKEKEKLSQKDLEKKRKFEGISEFNLYRRETLEQEKKYNRQQKLEIERKHEKSEVRLSEQKRHQERIAETKRLQGKELAHRQKISAEEIQRRRNRMVEDRSKHSNIQKKLMTNRNETSTSTSLKKRTFDERSEPASSSQAQKRRYVGNDELDFCRLDEATVNQNLSSIIHHIMRPGRQPMYRMSDDDDCDAMEVSGYNEVLREEIRSSRIARKEDDEEERAEQLRRMRRLKSKKTQH